MKPIDFQGIITLEKPIIDNLECYLQEKETQTGNAIVHAIQTLPRESLPPVLPFNIAGSVKLSDAVRAFGKNVVEIAASKRQLVPSNDWKSTTCQINKALWEYLEVLEGCITEFFQQIGQIGFEKWHPELMNVVDRIKDILNSRLDELNLAIKRLEALLWQYKWTLDAEEGKNIVIRKILYFWKTLLDRSLLTYLNKSKKFLIARHKWFVHRYIEYQKLKSKIEKSLNKFNGYHIFKSLEPDVQRSFKEVFKLLKLWDINTKWKSLPERETIRAIRSAYSMDSLTLLFRKYFTSLNAALFERSKKFKETNKELYTESSSKNIIEKVIISYRSELHTLGSTIEKYRKFFLRTHPNPYVRTRWGFSELIVGPEPRQTKELLTLVYDIEGLDKLFERLIYSLRKGPSANDKIKITNQYTEIQRILHEMGQPLTSRIVMRNKAEKILNIIDEMDELGSFCQDVVKYVGKTFTKALRFDWQYHVLFEIPHFYHLFSIHQGVVGDIDDRAHFNRMNKFKDLLSQLKEYVKKRDTHRRAHEIELDMNDMKGYLQDFLAYVQRIAEDTTLEPEKAYEIRSEIDKQLLEYRYIFGKFFHYLHQNEPEGKLIRNQFLFVDQYFETVENKLHEMQINLKA